MLAGRASPPTRLARCQLELAPHLHACLTRRPTLWRCTRRWKGAGLSLANILWLVVVIVVVLWLIGLVGSVGGSLIHLLLLLAVLFIAYNLFTGRRAV